MLLHLFNRNKYFLKNTLLKKQVLHRLFLSVNTRLEMGDKTGVSLGNIIEKLESFANTKTAESWDNVGLLIEPVDDNLVKKILLTNDLTEDVMKEAIDHQVGMIITYHPLIFKGMKSITTKNWKEKIVGHCLKHSIAVFSPHTSWDVVKGGVNEWLAKSLNPNSSEPLTESGVGRICHFSEALSVRDAVKSIKEHVGVPYVQLALAVGKTMDSPVSTVALCAGAGNSVLANIPADLYLTGEMSHHDVLDATHRGIHVVLCNHSNSERGFLKEFSTILKDQLLEGKVEVIVSEKDEDPLKTV